jgi:hypothetical protein
MSSSIRAFITEHKNDIHKTALFCTGDGDKPEKVFILSPNYWERNLWQP